MLELVLGPLLYLGSGAILPKANGKNSAVTEFYTAFFTSVCVI